MGKNVIDTKWIEAKREVEIDASGTEISKKLTFEADKKNISENVIKWLGLITIIVSCLSLFFTVQIQNTTLKQSKQIFDTDFNYRAEQAKLQKQHDFDMEIFKFQLTSYMSSLQDILSLLGGDVTSDDFTIKLNRLQSEQLAKLRINKDQGLIDKLSQIADYLELYKQISQANQVVDSLVLYYFQLYGQICNTIYGLTPFKIDSTNDANYKRIATSKYLKYLELRNKVDDIKCLSWS